MAKLFISTLQIHPVIAGSRLAAQNTNFDLFNHHRHFVLSPDMRSLAIAIEFLNLTLNRSRPRAVHDTFVATIYDADTREAITARKFSVRLDAATASEKRRVDLILPTSLVHPECSYSVEVTRYGQEDDGPEASSPLKFFCSDFFGTPKFTVEKAWFEPEEGVQLRSYDGNNTEYTSLKIAVESNLRAEQGSPDLRARYVCADGDEVKELATPLGFDDEGRHLYELGIVSSFFLEAPGYIEFTVLDEVIGGLVICTAGSETEGSFSANELQAVEGYTTEKGEEILAARETAAPAKAALPEPYTPKAMDTLAAMVGLEDVKARVESFVATARLRKLRRDAGLCEIGLPLHSLFIGCPGTGKTTVARLMGQMLKEAGILSSGHVVEHTRATLLGQSYNSESEKTLQAIEDAKGGILLIDEAYQLNQPNDPRDPGRLVLDALMTALADGSQRDWMLILAGYAAPTLELLELNPGLKSRIPAANIFRFGELSADELCRVAVDYFAAHDLAITDEAYQRLTHLIDAMHLGRRTGFGNAREVLNIIETEIIPSMAMRVAMLAKPGLDDITTISAEDIPAMRVAR